MRRVYFNCIVACLLSLLGLSGWAQTIYAGLNGTTSDWTDGNGWKFCVVGFDANDPSKVTEVPFKGDSDTEFEIAGCLAGKIYYAVMYDEDKEAYSLHSLNLTTGKDVKIADCEQVLDLSYDSKFDMLYALKHYSTDTEDGTAFCYVDTKKGTMDPVIQFKDKSYWGLAMKDGVAYFGENAAISGDWWNYNLELTTFNTETFESSTITGLGKVKNVGSSNCMEFDGDKLYVVQGRNFYTVDLAAKTTTKSEQTLPRELVGLCFAKSSEDAEGQGGGTVDPQPVDEGLVSVVEYYGDAMGQFQGMSRREVTFYNKDKKPVRRASYEASGEDQFTIARYYMYDYDENGKLVCTYDQQYGAGRDGDGDGFSAYKDSVDYSYDDYGRLAVKTDKGRYEQTKYSYDDNGELVKEEISLLSKPDEVFQTLTYSDFAAKGCPQSVKSASEYDYLVYEETFKYNDSKQKTERQRKAYTQLEDGSKQLVVSEQEFWKYDEAGKLVCDSLLKSGQDEWGTLDGKPVPVSKVVYSADNGSDNRTKAQTYTAAYDETSKDYAWNQTPTYTISQTNVFNPELATELAVAPVEGEINTEKLTFSVPDEAALGSYTFDVYRHGFKIARVNLTDEGAYDPETGTLNYVDKDVPNGTYDYFVQTVYSNDESGEEVGQTTSNVVRTKVYSELPAPTNVHAVEKGVDKVETKVLIAWDAPADYEKYGFKRYNVIFDGYRTADNFEADGQATEWVTDMAFLPKKFFVQAVYKYGKANSPVVEVNLDELPTGVSSLTADGQQAEYSNGVLTLAQPADVTVYAANGAQVLRVAQSQSVSLEKLPQGTYVVAVTTAGKSQVVKLAR